MQLQHQRTTCRRAAPLRNQQRCTIRPAPSAVKNRVCGLRTSSWSHAGVPVEHFFNQLSSFGADMLPFTMRKIHLQQCGGVSETSAMRYEQLSGYLGLLHTPQNFLCTASPEWRVATQQYVHDDAKTPDIARFIVPFLETSYHFRR